MAPKLIKSMPKAVRRGVIVFISALALLASGMIGAAAENYMRDANSDNKVAIRGCVVRFDERDAAGKTVPRIYANNAHYCVGVTSVSVVDGDLQVLSNNHEPVMSLVVSSDETLTRYGISCGASGGLASTVIRCYDRTGAKVNADSPRMYGAGSNLWLTWFSWQDV
ncbi:hypothetical protein ACQBAR_15540 [Propionibacteriaceae bacterium Y1685]